jgi:diguanylate cyclase (GGDEF)-like protein
MTISSQTTAESEIYADLVETLFDTTHTLVTGILSGVIVPLIAYATTGNALYLLLVALLGLIGVYRLAVLQGHQRAPVKTRRREAAQWERRYAIGAIGFMTMLGVSVAILFRHHHGEMISYYGVIIMTGVTGNLASRNAARPNIVFWQVMGTCMPLAVTLLIFFPVAYWGVSAFLTFGALSVFRTTEFLHRHLASALRNGLDASTQRQKFSVALDSMTHGLCMGDSSLTISVINRRILDFFGIVAATAPIGLDALARAIGRSAQMPAAEAESFLQSWMRHAAMPQATVFMHRIGDRYFDFHCERAGEGFVTVIEDVTTKERAVREIERIAHFDELTGLPNRYNFQHALADDLARLKQENLTAALLLIDLDRFKEVNDTLGHLVGDLLLTEVGARLVACAPSPHLVARLGGDEYCVLLRAAAEPPPVAAIAGAILDAMKRPFYLEGQRVTVGASIGVAVAPTDADTPSGLLRCSDLALYRAKMGLTGSYVTYVPQLQAEMREKRAIEEELREALAHDELVVFYQPIVDSRRGVIVSMEALLRWRHPQRGLVSPGIFIPVAEETGLILEMGAWVLRRACEDATNWPTRARVAVNLAPLQFQEAGLAEAVAEALRVSGLAPDRLELEITETALLSDAGNVDEKLAAIAALGVRLVLDDFGSGYSSLSYLNRFPVKKVKIDQAFCRQAHASPKTQAIIGAISTLARDLELDLVAEGVETHEQLSFMAKKNIFLIQGYLYSKPRPIEELAPLLLEWSDAPRLTEAA